MPFCSECGQEVGADTRFCPSCGHQAGSEPAEPAPAVQQPAAAPDARPAMAEPRNALGITALILALVGLMFGFVPLTGFVAFALGVTALILALSNRGRLRRGTATNRKSTTAAAIISVAAMGFGIWGMVIVFTAVDELDREFQRIGEEFDADMAETEAEMDAYFECVDQAQTLEEMEEC